MTNGERIRSMTDEELAAWLHIVQGNAWYRGRLMEEIVFFPNTNKSWLDWLKAVKPE